MKLPSAHQKLMRACKHLVELTECLDAFRSADENQGQAVLPPPGQTFSFHMPLNDPPIEVGLIFGDLIHCLRASLDHAAFELTRGQMDPKKVQFPFGADSSKLNKQLKQYKDVWSPSLIKAVRDEMRPFEIDFVTGVAGNTRLCAVHNLDIIDKHRDILLSTTWSKFQMRSASVRRVGYDPQTGEPIVQTDSDISTEVDVLLNEEGPFKAARLSQVAEELIDLVAEALNILEREAPIKIPRHPEALGGL